MVTMDRNLRYLVRCPLDVRKWWFGSCRKQWGRKIEYSIVAMSVDFRGKQMWVGKCHYTIAIPLTHYETLGWVDRVSWTGSQLHHSTAIAVFVLLFIMRVTCLHCSTGRQLVLETLYALASNTKIIKEAMAKGMYIHNSFSSIQLVVLSFTLSCFTVCDVECIQVLAVWKLKQLTKHKWVMTLFPSYTGLSQEDCLSQGFWLSLGEIVRLRWKSETERDQKYKM